MTDTAAAPPAGTAQAAAAPVAAAAPPVAAGGAGAPPPKPEGSILADAKVGDGAPPAPPALDDVRKYLTDKGVKPEDMQGLQEAQLRAKYDQEKAKEGKPAEAKPGDKAALELKLPEGLELAEEQRTQLTSILTDEKLSPAERGSKLLEIHAAALRAATQAPQDLWNATQRQWQDDVKADPEMGGTNFDQTRATVAKVIDELGGAEAKKIREAFNFTGAGNHPEIVRFVMRAGRLLTEGSHVAGKPAGQGAPKSAAETLYPNQGAPA